jgi:hypothetical protein
MVDRTKGMDIDEYIR